MNRVADALGRAPVMAMMMGRWTTGRVTLMVTLLAAGPALAGCLGGAEFESLALDAWKDELDATPDAFILDVRSEAEHADGHVPGAHVIPYDRLEDREDELPEDTDTPVFVYCQTGRRSAIGAATLTDLGYGNVVNLRDGGFPDWKAAGYPTAP